MEIQHTLILNGRRFLFSLSYERSAELFTQLNREIGIKFMRNEDYVVEAQVTDEVFQSFLNYLQNSQEPEINANNAFEFYLLSNEFGVLKNHFTEDSDREVIRGAKIDCLLASYDNNHQKRGNWDRSSYELYIAKDLDYYISNLSEKLYQVPINSLYNIFYHAERVLNDHKKAYKFIAAKLEGNENNNDNNNNNNNNNDNNNNDNNNNDNNNNDNNNNDNIDDNQNKNPDFAVLLESLDASKLDDNINKKLVQDREKNFGFSPKASENFVYKLDTMKKCITGVSKIAFEKENIDVINFLLEQPCFDINEIFIFNHFFV